MRTPTLSLRTHLVEQTTKSWMFWFGLLETFVKETGNCRVLDSYRTNDGYQLGKWIGKQRAKKIQWTLLIGSDWRHCRAGWAALQTQLHRNPSELPGESI